MFIVLDNCRIHHSQFVTNVIMRRVSYGWEIWINKVRKYITEDKSCENRLSLLFYLKDQDKDKLYYLNLSLYLYSLVYNFPIL